MKKYVIEVFVLTNTQFGTNCEYFVSESAGFITETSQRTKNPFEAKHFLSANEAGEHIKALSKDWVQHCAIKIKPFDEA